MSRVDIVIRYIEVDFTFGLPDYVRYIEEFVISRFYSIHFRASSYDPGYRDGSVSGMNFAVRSYGKFHLGYRDEKW